MAKKHRFDYFDAFVRQAEVARRQSQALVEAMRHYQGGDPVWMREQIDAMHVIEKDGDDVCHEVTDRLAVEFIPPIDAEDVSELCSAIDDVTDYIEEVVQHLYMFGIVELHPTAVQFACLIDESVEALAAAAKAFREFKKPKKLERLLVAVHDKESEADVVYMQAKHDVFTAHPDAPITYLVAWNDMFSHMEICCDACEKVATVMQKIALKNA